MAEQLPDNIRVLRLFGVPAAAVQGLIDAAHDKDIVHASCMQQGGEVLLLLEATCPTPRECASALNRWERRVQASYGDALYATGSTTLVQAAMEAMETGEKLFVCADEAAAALLDPRLEGLPAAEKVYDFGATSYRNAAVSRKLAAAARKYDDPVLAASARAKAALRASDADYALAVAEAPDGGQWLVMGTAKEYYLRLVAPEDKPALWLLDLLRRAASGCPAAAGTELLRYGKPLPAALGQAPAKAAAPQGVVDSRLMQQEHTFEQELPEDDLLPEEPPAPPTAPARRMLEGLLFVLVAAVFAAALLWFYTGGDFSALWLAGKNAGSAIKGASLL